MDNKNRFEEEKEMMGDVNEQITYPDLTSKDIDAIEDEEIPDSIDEINPDVK